MADLNFRVTQAAVDVCESVGRGGVFTRFLNRLEKRVLDPDCRPEAREHFAAVATAWDDPQMDRESWHALLLHLAQTWCETEYAARDEFVVVHREEKVC